MDTYILPMMTYAADYWALSETQLESLAVAQRKMERQMIGVSLLDHKTNTWIRQQTQVVDIRTRIKESKHRWAGHVARMTVTGGHQKLPLGNLVNSREAEEDQA